MEELKLILETISKISGDASTVAIWWVALHYSTKILTSIIVFGGVAVIVYIIAKAFQNTSEWSNLAKSIVKAHGGRGGYCVFHEDEAAAKKAIEAAKQ